IAGRRHLAFSKQRFLFNILIKATRQGASEAREVSAPVPLWNIIGETVDVLLKRIVPLQSDFYGDSVITVLDEMKHAVQRRLVLIQIFHEGSQDTFIKDIFALAGALVSERNSNAIIQEGQFTNSLGENIVMENDVG